jgi:7,8-dihydropterin-6-yl-methyl-4-(beta-D-ribofuranosyl)aminobenzene 5'-phosphate synthase
MKIIALLENKTTSELVAKHGLSLYIETANHKILFDVGPDKTAFENSEKLGIDLSEVDIVILSHGHSDHGGALEHLLNINQTAKVYVQKSAFKKHYAKTFFTKKDIGIDAKLQEHPQVILLEGNHEIDNELLLFTVSETRKCYSDANKVLYTEAGRDDFTHEQNLMIRGAEPTLIMGCGHTGIVNILEEIALYEPKVCVGGYHLWNPIKKKTVSTKLLDEIAEELKKHEIHYYTCHCTGQEAFDYLAARVPNMRYLSCGEEINV